MQEAEEGTPLGKSSGSLKGALGGDLAGAMTRSVLQALRNGGSAGQHLHRQCASTPLHANAAVQMAISSYSCAVDAALPPGCLHQFEELWMGHHTARQVTPCWSWVPNCVCHIHSLASQSTSEGPTAQVKPEE